ncbi:MAG: CDP-alcohol phosphatidyltransferase family protein [Bifidobacteriaceae bacterium]|jgi:cardiolipin synthase|nr:CDP-alcohol phosphatidyltransferase family protein [Bifidobacteriaceae bacterium]
MEQTGVSDRVLTVPNAISALRLAMVPLFCFLVVRHWDVWAIVVMAASGVTDWLDGFAARRLGQYSRLGRLLDPAADRLFILSTVFLLGWRAIIPWWLVGLLAAREALMGGTLLALKSKGIDPPQVVFVGKAATFALMYAFPLLLLAEQRSWIKDAAWVVGWACAIWGLLLYWVACVAYLIEAYRALQAVRSGVGGQAPPVRGS